MFLHPIPLQPKKQQQQQQDHTGQHQQEVHLNWSNFKPEFSGKPDEEAEAHLLCLNDWMNAHHFVDGVKVQIFENKLANISNIPNILSYTIGRGMIMVSIIRTYKCRLARVTKFT